MQIDRPFPDVLSIILIILSLFGTIIIVTRMNIQYSNRWLPGISIGLFLFVAGYVNTNLNTPKFNDNNIIHFSGRQLQLIVQLTEPVAEKPNSYKIVVRTIGIKDSLIWQQTSGKLVLYFEKDSTVKELKYGDRLIVQTHLNPISPPQNPK
ncbi:MAG: DUF4131 domain-containing protein [Bacteroidales bacterium]